MLTELSNDLWTAAIVAVGLVCLSLWGEDRLLEATRRTSPALPPRPSSGLWRQTPRAYDRRTTSPTRPRPSSGLWTRGRS